MMRRIYEVKEAVVNKMAVVCGRAAAGCKNAITNIAKEEAGVSDMVTAVVLIVIVIVVAALFKNTLVKIINSVGEKVLAWIKAS